MCCQLASTAADAFLASYGAVQVEHAFKDVLQDFHPQPKFWGTKILVSAAGALYF